MSMPLWVRNLKHARMDQISELSDGIAWQASWGHECDCVDVTLGQFEGGLWFCGTSAGDTATEALAREFVGCAKAMLDNVDGLINGDPHPHARNAMDGGRIMDWYIEARRAELEEGK